MSALRLCKPPVLAEVYPLHQQEDCKSLMSMLKWSLLPSVRLDVQHIRNYFGTHIILGELVCIYSSSNAN